MKHAFLVTLCLAAAASSSAAELLPAEALLATPRPLVIAHRGWSGLAPENTLPAFECALRAEADLVELDYHHSADGVPMVIHDSTLGRTTDATARAAKEDLRVAAWTLEELKQLDAGAWFHSRFRGTPLPTLAEALELIRARSVTLIERKAGDAATLAALLRERGLVNRVVVQSFDWDYLRALRTELPDQVLGALGPRGRPDRPLTAEERVLSATHLDEIAAIGAQVAVWSRHLTRDSMAAARARGLKVWIYTVNDAAVMRELIELGVDGIITDEPARAWRALVESKPATP